MERFSEKSLLSLGDNYYVYGLIDPRSHKFFYIGKGKGNRVFEHERESLENPNSEQPKLRTISEIREAGMDVLKVIIHANLIESEAYAAEAALINAFNFISSPKLTNILSGHNSVEALLVEEYEREYGAEELTKDEIKHRILVVKINQLYQRNMDPDALYDAVRGVWRASIKKVRTIDYVFGVYNSLIVAVYKPTRWLKCKDAKDLLPRQDIVLTPKTENRVFFIDEGYEQGQTMDANQRFYCGKSLSAITLNHNAQNPITYLFPENR